MKRSLERKITVGFVASLIVMAVIALASYNSIQRFLTDDAWNEHTRKVLLAISRVSNHLSDSETATRGFVLTGEAEFLVPYESGVGAVTPELNELKRLTQDNPNQRARIAQLRPLVSARLAEMQQVIELRRSKGLEAARAVITQGQGLRDIERVRHLFADMDSEENRLLLTRSAAAATSARVTNWTICAGSVADLILVALAGWLIHRDIAARGRAEGLLRESESRYRFLADAMPQMIWTARPDGSVSYYNARWHEYTGMTSEQTLGWGWEPVMHPDDLQPVLNGWLTACRTGRLYEGEYRLRKGSDRSFRYFLARACPRRNAANEIVEWIGTITDVDDKKQAESRIAALNDSLRNHSAALEAANKELEAFSYSVSHDLRSPLRGIDGFCQALLEDYNEKLDEEGKNHLRRVRAASQRMAQLIDDMLNLSRVTRTEMRRERVDLSTIAGAVAAELQKSEPDRKVDFVIAEGLITTGDPALLRIVLDNLLGNAWKFTGKRDQSRIEMGLTASQDGNTFYVRDNGAGFDMAFRGKLFGVFQRLHATSEFSGTGVGLATVQRIITRHGGRIWAEGEVGKGAAFHFTLNGQSNNLERAA